MNKNAALSRPLLATAAAAAALLAGCATTQVDAQWRSVDLPASYLRGATVLVSCETPEVVLQRICEDRLMADLAARGVRPVLAAPGSAATMQPSV
ncbi:MAG: hypothetical protein H7Y61_17105, partial [Rhizobiales bacterium]|nr:hypothetical protein [Rhizobacter sp.]